jgi:D-3-phosphoglycerate dehydrogenase
VTAPVVAIASYPYGHIDPEPVRLLEARGARLVWNPHPRKLVRAELIELLDGASAVVASTEPYDAEVFAANPQLRLVARTGVGLDSVDLDAARAHGVAVSSTPDGPADSVAELVIGLAVCLARHVGPADRGLRKGDWNRLTGWLLKARTIGIVGFGRIGTRVARLLAPFGCTVVATDIDPSVAGVAQELGVELLELDALLARADLITLHVPLTDKTRGLVTEPFLAAMKPGALLINTARGPVVDEAALLAALQSEQLGGAAIDVFNTEPYTGPLAACENVILTAHMGSCSDEGRKAMELGAARAVAAFLDGDPIPGLIG